MLPDSFGPLLERLSAQAEPKSFLFPTFERGRHLSPRTVQRVVQRAAQIAEISKHVTPHLMRHCFATHMRENRFIQQLLGHERLETTTLYTKVAATPKVQARSPLDLLLSHEAGNGVQPGGVRSSSSSGAPKPRLALPARTEAAGRLRIELAAPTSGSTSGAFEVMATLHISGAGADVTLGGILIREPHAGWVTVDVPPLEAWRKDIDRLSSVQRERIFAGPAATSSSNCTSPSDTSFSERFANPTASDIA
jgi:hypothetical protein